MTLLPVSDHLYITVVFLPSCGVIMVLTLWGQLVKIFFVVRNLVIAS